MFIDAYHRIPGTNQVTSFFVRRFTYFMSGFSLFAIVKFSFYNYISYFNGDKTVLAGSFRILISIFQLFYLFQTEKMGLFWSIEGGTQLNLLVFASGLDWASV